MASQVSTSSSTTESSHRRVREHSSSSNALQDEHEEMSEHEPSFSSANFITSTPKKARGSSARGQDSDEDEVVEDSLRVSDTESLDLDGGDGAAFVGSDGTPSGNSRRLRLTRKSLSQLHDASSRRSNNNNQPTPRARAQLTAPNVEGAHNIDAHHGTDDQPQVQSMLYSRGLAYAPSPSTGSSTLVERDDHSGPKASKRQPKGKERDFVAESATVREDYESGAEQGATSSSSNSSSQPRIRLDRRPGHLSSYLESKTAEIAPLPAVRARADLRASAPATPLAPGAFPKTAKVSAVSGLRYTPPESTLTRSTPVSSARPAHLIASGSQQVQDAFKRYITGPNGALTLSAERRALLGTASARNTRASPPTGPEPPTPHPVGYYAFSPSTGLPVESMRDQRRHKGPLPPSAERRLKQQQHRGVAWIDEAGDAQDASDLDGYDEREGVGRHSEYGQEASPSERPRTSSKLEKALRHIGHHQRATESRPVNSQRQRDERHKTAIEAFSRERASVSSEDDESDHDVAGLAGRSAIEFAMAKSIIHDHHEQIHTSSPRRKIEPTSRQRSPSPISPHLPDLPPTISSESSPSKSPVLSRRSPRRQAKLDRTAQHETYESPISSTPPRRSFDPPAPLGTPAALASRRSQPSSQALHSVPVPTRLFATTSPETQVQGHGVTDDSRDQDTSLPEIVAELASAVRALTKPRQRAVTEHQETKPIGEVPFASAPTRRKQDSDTRRYQLEAELDDLERQVAADQVSRWTRDLWSRSRSLIVNLFVSSAGR